MKAILITLTAAVFSITAVASWAGDNSVSGTKLAANVRPIYPTVPDPGYIVYTGYAGALPGPSCYWTRMPIHDSTNNVIGWRGRPVAVCP